MRPAIVLTVALYLSGSVCSAQNISTVPVAENQSQVSVPRLIRLSGTLQETDGRTHTGNVELTLAIYKDQQGGAALWQEVQEVALDASGHYTVLLGAGAPEGLPLDLFTSGEARWLSVQVPGQAQEPRALLVSVPYALKAEEAESLGGTPASDFVTRSELQAAQQKSSFMTVSPAGAATSSQAGGIDDGKQGQFPLKSGSPSVTQGGLNGLGSASFSDTSPNPVVSVNQSGSGSGISVSTAAGTAGVFNQLGTGNILAAQLVGQTKFSVDMFGNGNFAGNMTSGGVIIPPTQPATATQPSSSFGFSLSASAYNSTTGNAVPQSFTWLAQPTNNNTANPGGTLDLIFVGGPNQTQNNTGLSIDDTGNITFARTQVFPAMVSSVTAGDNSILIGGTASAPTVSVNSSGINAGNIAPGTVVRAMNGLTDVVTLTAANGLNVGTAKNTVVLTTNATPNGQAGTIVSRDLSGNFSAGTLTLTGSLSLPNTTSGGAGVISLAGAPFLHNFGTNNTFVGNLSGNMTMGGADNVAVGYQTLQANISGCCNSAFGSAALGTNQAGFENSAFGDFALGKNSSGDNNTAVGGGALAHNTMGSTNTAIGEGALDNLLGGSNNIAVGATAGGNQTGNGSNNIYIGNTGVNGESNTIHIGDPNLQTATFISGIFGATNANGAIVSVNQLGQLGTTTSSRRYKHEIEDMATDSDVLMKLRPVSFYYKPELDETQTRQYGLVAEEVAQVAPQLVLFGDDGKPQTVRYHFVNAMLLNEVQKQRRELKRDENELARIRAENAALRAGFVTQNIRLEKLEKSLQRPSSRSRLHAREGKLSLRKPLLREATVHRSGLPQLQVRQSGSTPPDRSR